MWSARIRQKNHLHRAVNQLRCAYGVAQSMIRALFTPFHPFSSFLRLLVFFLCAVLGTWQFWELCILGIVHLGDCAFGESTLPQKLLFRARETPTFKNLYFLPLVSSTQNAHLKTQVSSRLRKTTAFCWKVCSRAEHYFCPANLIGVGAVATQPPSISKKIMRFVHAK